MEEKTEEKAAEEIKLNRKQRRRADKIERKRTTKLVHLIHKKNKEKIDKKKRVLEKEHRERRKVKRRTKIG